MSAVAERLNRSKRQISKQERVAKVRGWLALRENNLTTREVCPVCGHEHKDAVWPAWVFGYETKRDARRRESYVGALCFGCADERAPDLVCLARGLALLCRMEIDPDAFAVVFHAAIDKAAPVNLSEPPFGRSREPAPVRAPQPAARPRQPEVPA